MLAFIGFLICGFTLLDIFLTVLHARSGTGWLSPWVNEAVWRTVRTISRALPYRDTIRSYNGPLVLVAIVVVWAGLLNVGLALLVLPGLGTGIVAPDGPTDTGFVTALYYSGYSFLTIGHGDLVPQTGPYRLLMIAEGFLGYSVLTLSLTYFMSVFSALVRRNTFALSLHHASARTGDAAELLARLLAGGTIGDASNQISGFAARLEDLHESHHFYPVLHYFYFPAAYYALARIILVALELPTLIRCALPRERYGELIDSAAVEQLWSAARHLIDDLGGTMLRTTRKGAAAPAEVRERAWHERYRRAVARLRENEVETVTDAAGAARYLELREPWDDEVKALAEHMGRDWHEVAPFEESVAADD